jgi:hypothetical protein
VLGVLAFTDVQWQQDGGEGVAGLAGLGSVGVDWSVRVRDWLTPYLRTGVGANVYFLGADGACIPEEPTCGLHHLYTTNHLDPAVQIALGAEFSLLGRGVVVEGSDSWSRFTAGDSSTTQRFLSFGIGMGF